MPVMHRAVWSVCLILLFLPVALYVQTVRAEVAALLSAPPLPQDAQRVPVAPKGFVLDGDSITDGYGVTPAYPDHLATMTGLQAVNLGVSGRTLAQMADTFGSRGVAELFDEGQRDTLVLLGGINDMLHDPATTPETLQRQLLDYAAKSREAGFRLVVVTLLPVDGLPPQLEFIRASHNRWIGANWPTFADALADAASEPSLSDPSDSRHYSDGLHLTAEGLRVLATVVQNAAWFPADD